LIVGFRLTPQENSFYDLFATSASYLVDGSRELTSILAAGESEREVIAARMREIEHAADEATHEIIKRVNSSFITPFDREDIHGLAAALDDCMDLMDAAVDLIVLYRVGELPSGVSDQVEVLARMTELTAEAMPRLRAMKDLAEYWIEINRLENHADQTYRRLLAELFNGHDTDAIKIMKHKEIIEELEAAADAFEQVAHKVESIAVKES
jgi:predicted phosphate transport protein (TIGR00153 family)